jgi:hypothetical protein
VVRFALALLIVLPAFAQVRPDILALESRPSLAAWQRAHLGERFEPAHYETSNDGYEVDYARRNRWCAASIRQTGNLTRAALFYVPVPPSGALPALPVGRDPGLTRACELDAIWYESRNENDFGSLVRELSASWGEPNGASSDPDIAGWALWKNRFAWHRSGLDIWAATKPGKNGPHPIVYGRRNMPRDWDVMDRWFGSVTESQTLVAQEVARIAALDSALTSRILSGSRCGAGVAERDAVPIEPLGRWLTAAQTLTPARRAAALLLADFYVTCAGTTSDPDKLQERLMELGAHYETRFPQDGPDYAHNFREQAQTLDPRGPAGELAGLVSLNDPCFLKGEKPWPDLLIEKGTKMLNAFPITSWTPYVHLALARAHSTKLSYALGGDPEGGVFTISPAMIQHERSAAISQFRYFVKQKPGTPESVFAWQEAWRLLADLPPSQIHFGCSGE